MKLAQSQQIINNFKDEQINKVENELKQIKNQMNNLNSQNQKIEEILNNSIINVYKENNINNDNQNKKENITESISLVNQSNAIFKKDNDNIIIEDSKNE